MSGSLAPLSAEQAAARALQPDDGDAEGRITKPDHAREAHVELVITKPASDSTVKESPITVEGRVEGPRGTTVFVDGVEARVSEDGRFVAQDVRLSPLHNSIRATATAPGGKSVEERFKVTLIPSEGAAEPSADRPLEGLPPGDERYAAASGVQGQAASGKPVSEWTPDDYQRAFDRIEADHSSSDPVVRSSADAAVTRSLNSFSNAGIDSRAAADLVSSGSTDTVMTNVMQVRRTDGTQVQLLLKNGIRMAEGAQFFYSKDRNGQLTGVVVPVSVLWTAQYWCEDYDCYHQALHGVQYYGYTYGTGEPAPFYPQFGLAADGLIGGEALPCHGRYAIPNYCSTYSNYPIFPDSNKTYSVSGSSYEGNGYSAQVKLADLPLPPIPSQAELESNGGYWDESLNADRDFPVMRPPASIVSTPFPATSPGRETTSFTTTTRAGSWR